MKSGNKRKLGFIVTVALSIFTVFSASVTTFAWFQANAEVNILTESSSTTITVNKPDDYTFYGYNGNTNRSFSPNGTFSNDFTALTTSALVNTYTNFTNMVPGQIYVFAIGATAASSINLTLNSFVSNNATKQNILDSSSALQKRYVYGQSYEINVGYAMDIFVSTYTPINNASPTGYTSFLTSTSGSDKFNYSIGTAEHRALLDSGTHASPEIEQDIEFYTNASLTSTNDIYIMWSVVFSDANTVHYKEVTIAGIDIKEEPSTGHRYFRQDDNGNSNCFGGLDFALSSFTLTIG